MWRHGSKDIETRRCVAFALNNVAANEKNHVVCDRLGVIKPLIALAHEEDMDTHLQAIIAMRHLASNARNSENKMKWVE